MIIYNLLYLLAIDKIVSNLSIFSRKMYLYKDANNVIKLSGNKGRKFQYLLNNDKNISSIVSYGGLQSNAMLALAQICNFKKWKYYYITKKNNSKWRGNPIGNYKLSLELGMKLIETDSDLYSKISIETKDSIRTKLLSEIFNSANTELLSDVDLNNMKWIPQGGASSEARYGLEELAKSMKDFIVENYNAKPWKIILASGTGTSAFFLARYFSSYANIEVIAVPCVGSDQYLRMQLLSLSAQLPPEENKKVVLPTILPTTKTPKRIFAKPYKEHFLLWQALSKSTGIDFDLIYAPRVFEILLSQCNSFNSERYNMEQLMPDSNILYYHCGGTEGNPSQIARYKYLKLT